MRGIKYPLTVVKGQLQTSSGHDYLKQQVKEYVDTEVGSRVFWRDYGCGVSVFENLQDPLVFTRALEQDLRQWLDFDGVSVENLSDGVLEIGVVFKDENVKY